MSDEYYEKDVYVLLDFQGKDTKFLSQPGVYFRMLNLNEIKPIVEIGEDVYEGTYDETVGTNAYFEEVENPPPKTNIFEGGTPITLQYLLKQTKILKMKKIGTKPKPVVNTNLTETVNINIEDDYRILLEKFKKDKLNIEEYITESVSANEEDENEYPSSKSEEDEEHNEQWQSSKLPPRQSSYPEWYTTAHKEFNLEPPCSTNAKQEEPDTSTKVKNVDPTYMKYVKLQKLAEQPTRHKINPELVNGNLFVVQPIHSIPWKNFIAWKNLVMQCVELQQVNLDINKDKMEDFVDIEKSIKAGIISPSNENPRIFTREEKHKLLSFENFINISPLMKLIMLQDYLQLEKAVMAEMSEEKLNTKGEDGCTVKERFKLLKNFKEELRSHMILRLQDGFANNEASAENLEDNIPLNLLDNEELSDSDFSYSSDDDGDGDLSSSKPECEGTSSDISDNEQQSALQPKGDENRKTSDRSINKPVLIDKPSTNDFNEHKPEM